jgi:hypothetical protein
MNKSERTYVARHERSRTYTVHFASYIQHALKHLPLDQENWPELIQATTPDQYLDFVFDAIGTCFELPRYLSAREFLQSERVPVLRKKSLLSVLSGANYRVRVSPRETLRSVIYFGHDSGVLIVGVRKGANIAIVTAYRKGETSDLPARRLYLLKRKVRRLSLADAKQARRLRRIEWIMPATWGVSRRPPRKSSMFVKAVAVRDDSAMRYDMNLRVLQMLREQAENSRS